MKPRTAMVTIITLSTLFTLFNLGLSRILNINIIVVLDVIMWVAFHFWLNKRIKKAKAEGLSR